MQIAHGGLCFLLGADRRHGFSGAMDRPRQLVRPLHRVVEDLHEGLDHRLKGRHVVVPHDDRPEVLIVEEGADVGVADDLMVDGGLVVEDERHEQTWRANGP